jgi:hypothetical protein
MITGLRPLIEINQQAIRLLYKELGVVDAVRFLKQFTQGYGNYTGSIAITISGLCLAKPILTW